MRLKFRATGRITTGRPAQSSLVPSPGRSLQGAFIGPFLLVLGGLCANAFGGDFPKPVQGPTPQAPPPAPPIQEARQTAPALETKTEGKGLTLYSIGQPTDEEELYLEFLNRMRANPAAEGQRLATTTDPNVLASYSYFSVNLALMQNEFSTNPPVPPLALNSNLISAARWHSGDMFTNVYQGHYQTNGATVLDPGGRITAMGYPWAAYGENVYSYADSVWHGHAGFAVDWGPGTGGMQDPAGHRANMLAAGFREVGMGVVDGVNGAVGPQLVTQDFGRQPSDHPFILGVVYYDFNGNGFYDIGEGIGGVTVNTLGSPYYAVTADSGGFAIPVTSNGTYTLTFNASGLSTQLVVAVSSLKNQKVDYLPVYTPPVISGPNPAGLNQSNYYTISSVGAATGYQWLQTQLALYTAVEGAENGLANVTVVSSPGYSVLATDLKHSGSYSFYLAQPDGSDQYLTLNPVLRIGSASALTFYKLLGWATPSQVAKAQVSTDSGATWQDVWSEAGSNGSGDSAFSVVNVSLNAFAGQNIMVRFAYTFTSGSYFNQTTSGVGFYVDDISVSGANQLVNSSTNTISSGASFAFYPASTNTFLLEARAMIKSRTLNWGPASTISVSASVSGPPPVLQLVSQPILAGNQIQVDFSVSNYRAGMNFQLWKASGPTGAWAQDSLATLQTLVANSRFRFTTATGAASQMFYRVKGLY